MPTSPPPTSHVFLGSPLRCTHEKNSSGSREILVRNEINVQGMRSMSHTKGANCFPHLFLDPGREVTQKVTKIFTPDLTPYQLCSILAPHTF